MKCSKCGNLEDVDSLYVACVSETTYSGDSSESYTHMDNVEYWKIHLCGHCQPQILRNYLTLRTKKGFEQSMIGFVLSCIGIISMYSLISSPEEFAQSETTDVIEKAIRAPEDFMNMLFHIVAILGVVIGIPCFFDNITISLKGRSRLGNIKSGTPITKREFDKCILVEGERILSVMDSKAKLSVLDEKAKSTEHIYGDYILPVYKNLNELPPKETKKAMKFKGNVKSKTRMIIENSVGSSINDLRKQMPKEYKQRISKIGETNNQAET